MDFTVEVVGKVFYGWSHSLDVKHSKFTLKKGEKISWVQAQHLNTQKNHRHILQKLSYKHNNLLFCFRSTELCSKVTFIDHTVIFFFTY